MKIKYRYIIGAFLLIGLSLLSFFLLSDKGEAVAVFAQDGMLDTATATGRSLGIVSLLPVIITVALAFITKEVVFSLLVGLFSGCVILTGVFGSGNLLTKLGNAFTTMCGSILNTAAFTEPSLSSAFVSAAWWR